MSHLCQQICYNTSYWNLWILIQAMGLGSHRGGLKQWVGRNMMCGLCGAPWAMGCRGRELRGRSIWSLCRSMRVCDLLSCRPWMNCVCPEPRGVFGGPWAMASWTGRLWKRALSQSVDLVGCGGPLSCMPLGDLLNHRAFSLVGHVPWTEGHGRWGAMGYAEWTNGLYSVELHIVDSTLSKGPYDLQQYEW